jgi:predicted metal-binding membrane protein
MTASGKTNTAISILILGISVMLWILLLANPGKVMTVQHCHVTTSGPSLGSLQMLLEMNPISTMLAGWILMVFAMMLPKLIIPIRYIYESSFRKQRFWLALVFIGGYVAVWSIAGFFMIAANLGFNLLLPHSYLLALVVGIITLVWQFSPAKQRCLNRGHNHRTLAAFGWAAFRDAFLFGVEHGIWCVGAGWALMLLPMLLPEGHNVAMLFVTFMMLSEHLEHPQEPRWRVNFSWKLARIFVAQTRIRLNQG